MYVIKVNNSNLFVEDRMSKYIINDRVNKNNVDEFYTEFMNYSSKNNFENDELKAKYKYLEDMFKIKMN